MSFVRTVLGDIPAQKLGVTNYHEHLFQVSPLLPGDELDNEELSAQEARLLHQAGTNAMVDATPVGLGRNPEATARISLNTGMHVVATTGLHREEHYPPGHWSRDKSPQERADLFLSDLTRGCPRIDGPDDSFPEQDAARRPDGGTIPAGMLKAGVGYWSISPFERSTLEAVAVAHRLTGAPVMVHLEFCTAAHEVLDLLDEAGVPASSVILAHADRNPDVGLHTELAGRGAFLGYDGPARPRSRTDSEILDLIEALSQTDAIAQILLGGDVARASRYVSYGGMPGLAYLPLRFLPRLVRRIGPELVDTITRANPARALAWTGTGAGAGTAGGTTAP